MMHFSLSMLDLTVNTFQLHCKKTVVLVFLLTDFPQEASVGVLVFLPLTLSPTFPAPRLLVIAPFCLNSLAFLFELLRRVREHRDGKSRQKLKSAYTSSLMPHPLVA